MIMIHEPLYFCFAGRDEAGKRADTVIVHQGDEKTVQLSIQHCSQRH